MIIGEDVFVWSLEPFWSGAPRFCGSSLPYCGIALPPSVAPTIVLPTVALPDGNGFVAVTFEWGHFCWNGCFLKKSRNDIVWKLSNCYLVSSVRTLDD